MKKLVFLLGVIALTATPALAQDMWIGGTLGYGFNSMTSSDSTAGFSGDAVSTTNNFNVTLLADITYLRVGVGYTKNIGEGTETYTKDYKTAFGSSVKTKGLDESYLNLSVLGKYPFSLSEGRVSLWPAIGLGYDINLTAKTDDGKLEDKALNDVYLLGGVGVDYNIDDGTAITFSAIYGYNLTPKPYTTATTDVTYSGYKVNVNIGFLVKM